MTAARHLQLVDGELDLTALNTALVRRFLGVGEAEPIEITIFVEGRIYVAHALTAAEHTRLLREAETIRGYCGAYQLVNGPMDPALVDRYEPNRIHKAWNGRTTDRDIASIRALFIDTDTTRPKGISATDQQLSQALEVSTALETWLGDTLGDAAAIGHGCSGNGYFTLVAVEPVKPTAETTSKISAFLGLLQKRFGTDTVKIDCSTFNPARLMPAPGTWKRKGRNTPERPHRQTSFICRGTVRRVPIEALIG